MHNFIKSCLLSLLLASSGWAQDLLLFNNGDVLQGKILKQDGEKIDFHSEALGTVSLHTRDIAEVQTQASAQTNSPAPAEALLEPVEKAKNSWSGQTGLAIASRKSNTLRRSGDTLVSRNQENESYRAYGNVKWEGERNNLAWDWSYLYSESDLRKNDDYLNITQNYQHNFTKKYFATANTMYQEDFRRGIEQEYLQTAELGVNWIDTGRFRFKTSAGGGYHQYDRLLEKYSNESAKFVFNESLRWKMVNSLTLFQRLSHLGNLSNYHLVFTSGLENKLIRDLFLRVEYRLDRDTDIANSSDEVYYDKALLTSLLYKF